MANERNTEEAVDAEYTNHDHGSPPPPSRRGKTRTAKKVPIRGLLIAAAVLFLVLYNLDHVQSGIQWLNGTASAPASTVAPPSVPIVSNTTFYDVSLVGGQVPVSLAPKKVAHVENEMPTTQIVAQRGRCVIQHVDRQENFLEFEYPTGSGNWTQSYVLDAATKPAAESYHVNWGLYVVTTDGTNPCQAVFEFKRS